MRKDRQKDRSSW